MSFPNNPNLKNALIELKEVINRCVSNPEVDDVLKQMEVIVGQIDNKTAAEGTFVNPASVTPSPVSF